MVNLLPSFMLVLGLVSPARVPDRKHEFDILIVLHIHGGKKNACSCWLCVCGLLESVDYYSVFAVIRTIFVGSKIDSCRCQTL